MAELAIASLRFASSQNCPHKDRPILLIGHSLGGIVIEQVSIVLHFIVVNSIQAQQLPRPWSLQVNAKRLVIVLT